MPYEVVPTLPGALTPSVKDRVGRIARDNGGELIVEDIPLLGQVYRIDAVDVDAGYRIRVALERTGDLQPDGTLATIPRVHSERVYDFPDDLE